jgi:hypothetical protein
MDDDTHAEAAALGGDPARADLLRERERLLAEAAALPGLERDIARLRRDLAAIEGSLSWRATTPLRRARRLVDNRRELALTAGRRLKRRLER